MAGGPEWSHNTGGGAVGSRLRGDGEEAERKRKKKKKNGRRRRSRGVVAAAASGGLTGTRKQGITEKGYDDGREGGRGAADAAGDCDGADRRVSVRQVEGGGGAVPRWRAARWGG